MHRSYQPILPAQSKLLQRRWDAQDYDLHRNKLRRAASTIDTRPPKSYLHLHLKLKKLQYEEERLATIDRDNRLLLGKMYSITREPPSYAQHYKPQTSLYREMRIRELLRITGENQRILKNILTQQPHYNHGQWELDWQEHQRHVDSISMYPRPKQDTARNSVRSSRVEKEAQARPGKSTQNESKTGKQKGQSSKSATQSKANTGGQPEKDKTEMSPAKPGNDESQQEVQGVNKTGDNKQQSNNNKEEIKLN